MPILIDPPGDGPLTQGDLLRGLPLFATKGTEQSGNEAAYHVRSPLCMVISRPCAALRKPQVVVSAIEKVDYPVPGDLDTLERVRRFLDDLRDGYGTPDRFYLGQRIPNFPEEGRFFARLDSLYTLRLPQGELLAPMVKSHRIATLHEAFRRDLHRRIFSAFATLGFDDYDWYPEQDLDWIIAVGKRELSAKTALIGELEAEIAQNTAAGRSDRNKSNVAKVASLTEQAKEIQSQLAIFERERDKRNGLSLEG